MIDVEPGEAPFVVPGVMRTVEQGIIEVLSVAEQKRG